mgnify:CR=1 FL=1
MYLKKTYIIAEAGINHKGKFTIAKKFIRVAKDCGADAVKFQSFIPSAVVTKNLSLADYQKKNLKNDKLNMLDMISKYSLTQKEQLKLSLYAKRINIDFISSAFDLNSLEFLINKLKIKILKIPSGEITNFPYLKKIASSKKKIILSTGMSNLKEIKQALKVLQSKGLKRKNITVLHCNTAYPTPVSDVNLNVLSKIKKELNIKVGYSDHTLGTEVSIAAVALGADVIEKHFTLNQTWDGPDQKSSLNIIELKNMISSIRNIEKAMGSSVKKITKSEQKNIFFARKSIVAKKNILRGERFSSDNLTIKRPGNGISPMFWMRVIKKKSKKNFKIDEQIS